jgi:hypothetical protein
MNDVDTIQQIFSSPSWLRRYRLPRRKQGRLGRVVQCMLDALRAGQDLETYAQIRADFWYKGYVFTPCGVFRFDTPSEEVVRKALARESVRYHNLRRVSFSALLANWQAGGLWEEKKPLSALLLRTWQAREPDQELRRIS